MWMYNFDRKLDRHDFKRSKPCIVVLSGSSTYQLQPRLLSVASNAEGPIEQNSNSAKGLEKSVACLGTCVLLITPILPRAQLINALQPKCLLEETLFGPSQFHFKAQLLQITRCASESMEPIELLHLLAEPSLHFCEG